MKTATPILAAAILSLAGCSSPRPRPAVLEPRPEPSGVRLPERVQAYHVGRTVDSRDHLHEAHPIYRVEAEATWDLRPGRGAPWIPDPLRPHPAWSPVPTDDAVRAELRLQQEETARVLEEAGRLARVHQDLQAVIADMARVAREHARIGPALQDLAERQRALEDALQRGSTTLSDPGSGRTRTE